MSQKKDLSDQELMTYVALTLTALWVIFSLGALVVITAAIAMLATIRNREKLVIG